MVDVLLMLLPVYGGFALLLVLLYYLGGKEEVQAVTKRKLSLAQKTKLKQSRKRVVYIPVKQIYSNS